jgi:anaerobic glycerol-3-phosphate dehydrogenase
MTGTGHEAENLEAENPALEQVLTWGVYYPGVERQLRNSQEVESLDTKEYLEHLVKRTTLKQAILQAMADYRLEALVYPTIRGTAASLTILPLALRRSALHFGQIPRHWPSFVGMGLFTCLGSVCHCLAYQLTLTSYVV